jgi:hypothetical protein
VCKRVEGVEVYWTGTNQHGAPRFDVFWAGAFKFRTPAEGHAACNTHRGLANSEDWRVVRLRDRSERTHA